MENASKALIIAGAILVSIMIVALGVTIFNKAHSSADTTALDSTEITMFNQKFERFAGQSQSGSNVKSLISFAIANASTNKDDLRKIPSFTWKLKYVADKYNLFRNDPLKASDGFDEYLENLSNTVRSNIVSTKTYIVTLSYGESGLVNNINIEENHK